MLDSLKPTFLISALCLIGLLLAILIYVWEFIGVKEKFASKSEPYLWGGDSDTDNLSLDPFRKSRSKVELNIIDECSHNNGNKKGCEEYALSSGINCKYNKKTDKCNKMVDLKNAPCVEFSGKGKDHCEKNSKGIHCIYRQNGVCTGPTNDHEICDQHNARDSKGRNRATAACLNSANTTNGKVICDVDIHTGKCVDAKLVNNQKHTAEKDVCSIGCPTREACNAVKKEHEGKSGLACKWVEGVVDKRGVPIKAARCIPLHETVHVESPTNLRGVHSSSKAGNWSQHAMGLWNLGMDKKKGTKESSRSSKDSRKSKGSKGSRRSKGSKLSKGSRGSKGSKRSKSSKGSRGKKRMGKKGSKRIKSSKSSKGSKRSKSSKSSKGNKGKKGKKGSKRSKSSKSSKGSKGKKRSNKK
jgi:hypothetical protein